VNSSSAPLPRYELFSGEFRIISGGTESIWNPYDSVSSFPKTSVAETSIPLSPSSQSVVSISYGGTRVSYGSPSSEYSASKKLTSVMDRSIRVPGWIT
jgi:hypothetical protein